MKDSLDPKNTLHRSANRSQRSQLGCVGRTAWIFSVCFVFFLSVGAPLVVAQTDALQTGSMRNAANGTDSATNAKLDAIHDRVRDPIWLIDPSQQSGLDQRVGLDQDRAATARAAHS